MLSGVICVFRVSFDECIFQIDCASSSASRLTMGVPRFLASCSNGMLPERLSASTRPGSILRQGPEAARRLEGSLLSFRAVMLVQSLPSISALLQDERHPPSNCTDTFCVLTV